MSQPDPVLVRLAQLPAARPPARVAATTRERARERLRARPVHRLWTLALIGSVVGYLGWALHFAGELLVGR